jgi:hypothetical protein
VADAELGHQLEALFDRAVILVVEPLADAEAVAGVGRVSVHRSQMVG